MPEPFVVYSNKDGTGLSQLNTNNWWDSIMTFFQMKCFLSLAQTRKMSVTAAALGLSLSTLSKHIDKMEDELCVSLFSKNQHHLTLTREGELVFPSIDYIVKQYKEQCSEIGKYTTQNQRTASIVLAFHQKQIIRRLIAFMKAEPTVKLHITEAPASEVCAMLDAGTADIGIIYEQLVVKKYPVSITLRRDRIVAVVSDRHPLAMRQTISVKELRDETFFLFKGDHLMYQYQQHTCISAGFAPKEEHSDMRISTILMSVAAGYGVSLLVENTVRTLQIEGVVLLGLEEKPSLSLCAISSSVYPTEIQMKLLDFLLPHAQ